MLVIELLALSLFTTIAFGSVHGFVWSLECLMNRKGDVLHALVLLVCPVTTVLFAWLSFSVLKVIVGG